MQWLNLHEQALCYTRSVDENVGTAKCHFFPKSVGLINVTFLQRPPALDLHIVIKYYYQHRQYARWSSPSIVTLPRKAFFVNCITVSGTSSLTIEHTTIKFMCFL